MTLADQPGKSPSRLESPLEIGSVIVLGKKHEEPAIAGGTE
jgi:hypothetical protein